MKKNVANHRSAYCLFLTMIVLISVGSIETTSAQAHKNDFGPNAQINLTLKGCSGEIDLGYPGFKGNALDIEGSKVTVTPAGGEEPGEVIAYARSAHWLDANLALIFGRSKYPVGHAEWKRPTIISLVLMQDRRHPKRFTLTPADRLNPDFPKTVISCAEASASPI